MRLLLTGRQTSVDKQRLEFSSQTFVLISQSEPEWFGKHVHEKSPCVDNWWQMPLFKQGLKVHESIVRQSRPV